MTSENVKCGPVTSTRRALLYAGRGVLVTARVSLQKAPSVGAAVFPMLFDHGTFVPNDYTAHPHMSPLREPLAVGEALRLDGEELFDGPVPFKRGLVMALSSVVDRYIDAGPGFTLSASAELRAEGGR